jgi:hypothetical protein
MLARMDSLIMVVFVCVCFGVLAGVIAYGRNPTLATFFVYLVLGTLLPVLGLIGACCSQRAAVAGWFPDPWGQAGYRWHDGQQWTARTSVDA